MGVYDPNHYPECADRIRDLHRRQRPPLTIKQMTGYPLLLVEEVLGVEHQRYATQRMLEGIVSYWRLRGVWPHAAAWTVFARGSSLPSAQTIQRRFGSFDEAVHDARDLHQVLVESERWARRPLAQTASIADPLRGGSS